MINFLASMLKMAKIPFTLDEPLAQKSTFKIGGTAKIFITPLNFEQFESSVDAVRNADIPYFVIGGASNVVFPDGEFSGAIISTQNLKEIFYESDAASDGIALVSCQCGVPMAAFVDFCTKHNLSGAEQFAGLPGSVGGAVYMNARCFDRSISDILHSTRHIEFREKNSTQIQKAFCAEEWDYKKSPFQASENSRIILEATFRLSKVPAENSISEKCKFYIAERVDKGHFKFPSAGSVFKNNHAFGKPSGRIIDEAGLKGLQIGGAQIAPFHGNFIINVNNATSADVKQLVEKTQQTVKEKFGFDLEPEIIFV
ncbi:MAG: UDP-N-acetylmuramate dehydrogenase [Treponema sp.]|nr:UDP-N-acetylmuramate dehydrogenase [Treponema sp.]